MPTTVPAMPGPSREGTVTMRRGYGRHDEAGRGALTVVAELLGILSALIALWEFGARLNVIPGESPIERAKEVVDPTTTSTSVEPEITVPPIETTRPLQLQSPGNVQLSGSCERFTLEWDTVDGAERYVVERNGQFAGFTEDASYTFELFPDGKAHEYRVRASAFRTQSIPSESVDVGPCTIGR